MGERLGTSDLIREEPLSNVLRAEKTDRSFSIVPQDGTKLTLQLETKESRQRFEESLTELGVETVRLQSA